MGSQIDPIGFIVKTAQDLFKGRTITAGTGITVTNGDGIAGNPVIAMTSDPKVQTINAQTGTTYTIVPADFGQLVTINNVNPVTITVPTAAGGNFVDFLILSTGTVTFVGSGSVTITGKGTTASGQYTRCKLQWRVSTNVWLTGQGATIA